MVIDCLIKKRYYIPYITNKNSTTTEAIIQLLFQNIWKLYGLLLLFTLDKKKSLVYFRSLEKSLQDS